MENSKQPNDLRAFSDDRKNTIFLISDGHVSLERETSNWNDRRIRLQSEDMQELLDDLDALERELKAAEFTAFDIEQKQFLLVIEKVFDNCLLTLGSASSSIFLRPSGRLWHQQDHYDPYRPDQYVYLSEEQINELFEDLDSIEQQIVQERGYDDVQIRYQQFIAVCDNTNWIDVADEEDDEEFEAE